MPARRWSLPFFLPSSSRQSASACKGCVRPSEARSARGHGGPMMHPANGEIERYTDHYFNRTKRVIGKFGDSRVTYAIFMRRPGGFAPRLAPQWLRDARRRGENPGEGDP